MSFAVARSAAEWNAQLDARPSVITVGNFDGLHVGHQRILRAVVERARRDGLLAAAITFDPHPLQVLRPESAPLLITTIAQRLKSFEQFGLDAALVLKFDAALSQLTPEEFVTQIIQQTVHARFVLVGANFRFGHRHAGDVAMLEKLGPQHGFTVEIVPPVELQGAPVSSTRVRESVKQGHVEETEKLLGRSFALTGEIVPGAGRGGKIVFPTLNLAPDQGLLPAQGVYATETILAGKKYQSVTNIGTRPTFNGTSITVESHLLDFDEYIRKGRMEVAFLARLRSETKFAGAAQLRAQIQRDIEAARSFFAHNK